MNIVILTEVFYPDLIGGAGTYTYNLSKGLANRGHKITVVTRRLRGLACEEEIEGIKVFRANWNGIPIIFRPLVFCFSLWGILKNIKRETPWDFLIFNQPFAAYCALLSKDVNKENVISFFHSSWVDEMLIKCNIKDIKWHCLFSAIKRLFYQPFLFLMSKMERSVSRRAKKIVVLSRFSKDRVAKLYNVPADKIEIIPPAIDYDKFSPGDDKLKLRHKFNLPAEAFILLTVRNLVPRMGIDNLILAFKETLKKCPGSYLIIAGGGFLEKKLKTLATKLQLNEKINFVGPLSQDDLISYYRLADLFILPTKYLEGFGLVTLEAMASGLPVLGTPVGGTIEILSKFDENFIFADTAPQSMARKIIEFIDSKPDLLQLGKRCREFALKEYSAEEWFRGTEDLLQSIK